MSARPKYEGVITHEDISILQILLHILTREDETY